MMHNKDAETPCHGLFLIYRFRMAKKGKKRGIFFFTYVCMCTCLHTRVLCIVYAFNPLHDCINIYIVIFIKMDFSFLIIDYIILYHTHFLTYIFSYTFFSYPAVVPLSFSFFFFLLLLHLLKLGLCCLLGQKSS
jgi:hypothetical protein